jgi:serine/threonine protein kinase
MLNKIIYNRYKTIKTLNSNNLEQIYLAKNLKDLRKPICIVRELKLQSYNPALLKAIKKRFETEAETLRKIGESQSTPEVLDYFEEACSFYIVQGFVEGKSLRQELKEWHYWNENQVISFLNDMLQILDLVHNLGIAHQAIRPGNIIYRDQDHKLLLNNFRTFKNVLCPNQEQSLSPNSYNHGYNSPEKLTRATAFDGDICALGMTCIEALTGANPEALVRGSDKTQIFDWSSNIEIRSEFKSILNRMVGNDSQGFYPNARCVILDLNCLGESITTLSTTKSYIPTEIFTSHSHLSTGSSMFSIGKFKQSAYAPTELRIESCKSSQSANSIKGKELYSESDLTSEKFKFQQNKKLDIARQLSLELAECLTKQQKASKFNKILNGKTLRLCGFLAFFMSGVVLYFAYVYKGTDIRRLFPQNSRLGYKNLVTVHCFQEKYTEIIYPN